MIPNDVLGRVFCLRIGVSTATGFAIDVDGKQYLVTSRQFAMGASPRAPLLILVENQWYNLGGTVIGHAPGEVDVSVFVLNGIVAKPELELLPDQTLLYGQEVYFLGYPYGWWGEKKKAFVGRPVPFVRKAVVSCIEDGPDGAHRNFLDGYNFAGFAGGPVIYSTDSPRHFKVTSVVSSYQFVEQPIYRGNIALDENIRYNKGIIITYGIRHAIDIIRNKPVGISVS
jgi:hypothetical protein